MNNGYEQFFKKAQQLSSNEKPLSSLHKKQNQIKKNKSKQIPLKIVFASSVGLIIGFAGLQYSEKIEKFIKKVEINFLGSAVAKEDVKDDAKALSKEKQSSAEADKNKDAAKNSSETENIENKTSEDKSNLSTNEYIASLTQRQKDLDAKEEELKKLEAEIKVQKEELEKKALELDQTRRQISSVLQERIQVDEKKIESLVQVYTNMKPQQAAKIFEDMDEDLAVEIIGKMKRKNAAEIMNLMKPEKAKYYTEKYAGYKRNAQP